MEYNDNLFSEGHLPGEADGVGTDLPEIADDSLSAWFCVRSQPRHEHIATANLRRTLELEVVNPRIRFKRFTRRGPVWVTESLFPNYLFARFNWKASLNAVQYTSGVAGVVHFGSFWPSVPDEVIDDLRRMIGQDEVRVVEQTIQVGDELDIASGPFTGFRGVVTRVMPARDRVAVLLDFLGRQTQVELKMESVAKNGSGWVAKELEFAVK